MRLCPTCLTGPSLPYHAYCRECFNAYRRRTRPKYAAMDAAQRKKAVCRSYARVLEQRGALAPANVCRDCGATQDLERHFPDYSDPRSAEVVCRPCHRGYHRKPGMSEAEFYAKWGSHERRESGAPDPPG